MKIGRSIVIALSVAGVAAVVLAGLEPSRLVINGNAVSTDSIEKNGRTYVPLSDVAKALGYTLEKSGQTFTLNPPGGANQVEGLNGKIGQVIRTPQFTFEVVKVTQEDHHQKIYTDGTVDAPDGETLVIVQCRMKNATNETFSINPFGQSKTALTDQDAHTLGDQYTGGGSDVPQGAHDVLPGSAFDFNLVFHVKKDTKLKDLIYEFDGSLSNNHTVLRISLDQSQ